MALTKDQVLHVAQLARLELTDNEAVQLGQDLSRILEHVERLSSVDTTSVPATFHMGVGAALLRVDSAQYGTSTEDALRPAARTLAGGFAVPAIIEE